MAQVAVNKDGTEIIADFELKKSKENGIWYIDDFENCPIILPKGSIKKLIGKELSWKDKPIELK